MNVSLNAISNRSRFIRAARFSYVFVLALAVAGLSGGCLSRPSLVKQYFTLSGPAPPPTSPAAPGPVLEVRKLVVAAPFDSLSLIYRTGEFSYERDPYAEFLVPPAEDFAAPVRGYFKNSGAVREVVVPGSPLKPDLQAEIAINRLYGDFRNRSAPTAVLAMSFIIVNPSQGSSERIIMEKSYQKDIPLKARTAAALVAGWNEALQQIMSEAGADLKQTLGAAAHPGKEEKRP